MRIELQGCVVRAYRVGDEVALTKHANNPRIARWMRDRFSHLYSLDDARAWITRVTAEDPLTSWAIEIDGAVGGGIGIIPQDDVFYRSAEIGYWLGEAYWGRGVASAVVRAVSEQLFVERDLCRLYASVFDGNGASGRVLEKAGYVFEGRHRAAVTKNGETLDQLLYARVELRDRSPVDVSRA
jgi:RimJ/RimL family protein N-acetyltransferase